MSTEPISSVTSRRPEPAAGIAPDQVAGPPPDPAKRASSAPRELPEYPDTDQALVANTVKAATAQGAAGAAAGAPHLMLAMKMKVEDVEPRAPITPVQKKIDDFHDRAKLSIHTPEGDATVPIPFRMTMRNDELHSLPAADPFRKQEERVRANAPTTMAVAKRVGLTTPEAHRVLAGRGTPEQVGRLAQGLVKEGKLPPGTNADLEARLRTMMTDHGVGLDCAGYVQQAFKASHPAAHVQLKDLMNENLQGLSHRGFKTVSPAQAHAGDLLILNPPKASVIGHTMIVRDARVADSQDLSELSNVPAEFGTPEPGKVRRYELDSSWGNGAQATVGGVKREVYVHNEATGRWAQQVGHVWRVDGPNQMYGHPVDHFYRPAQEP